MTIPDDGLPRLTFASAGELEAWLEEHHGSAAGAWLLMAKKHTGIPSIDWDGAVDALLCFGWIDGQRRAVDDTWFAQRITPRRPRSVWSKVNLGRVEALERAGRMRDAGRAQVERAKADGRWDAAYDPPSKATPPPELEAALAAASDEARARFAALSTSTRYSVLWNVQTAKRAETRERRAANYVEQLERDELH